MKLQQRSLLLIVLIVIIPLIVFFSFCPISRTHSGSFGKVKRVVFITIDTLRADHLASYGYEREVSPFINSLARRGVSFKKAFTAAPHTAPSHATMFTGLYPFEHNLLKNYDSLDPATYSLHKFAHELGFNVQGFPAVKFMEGRIGFPFVEGITNGKDKNFKKFWYRNAQNVVDNSLAWLDSLHSSENFLIWAHFYDVHQWERTKNFPKEYREKVNSLPQKEHLDFLKKDREFSVEFFGSEEKSLNAINGYDARLLYVDDQIKRIYDYLSSKGLLEETLWIITSDHGEGLGNHGYKGHGEFLYQEQLHIPLIFFMKDTIESGRSLSELVRTVDLFPTIAEILGSPIDPELHRLAGASLVPFIKGDAGLSIPYSFAERRPKDEISFRRSWEDGEVYSLHNNQGKYISHSHGVNQFYNLNEDPFETKNIEGSGGEVEIKIKNSLDTIFDPRKRKAPSSNGPETPEALDELKSLGYL